MSSAHRANAHGTQGSPPPHSLRALLDARRAAGTPLSLEESVALLLPICNDLAERNARGEALLVHPASICGDERSVWRYDPRFAIAPTTPGDVAALAPEPGARPGGAAAAVYGIGAILYECVTGASVGPGMKPPRDFDERLPPGLDVLLAAALVPDPSARPGDLIALRKAMEQLRIERPSMLSMDVRFSILPSNERSHDPFAAIEGPAAPPPAPKLDATTRLAQLKARLESDPRPRYVVIKESMDHGPFNAVELLQQIASHSFMPDHVLRDEITGESRKIIEWEDFAPFAEHTKIHREIVAEKKEVVALEKAEKKAGLAKYLVGAGVTTLLLGGLLYWYFQVRGARNDASALIDDPSSLDLTTDGGLKGTKKPRAGQGGPGGVGGGGFVGGGSYEAAIAANNEEIRMGSAPTGPDLSNVQLSAPMANAPFISGCGAPNDMKVTVKVAIKMGRAVGVSVYTTPPNGAIAGCIAGHVRGLAWPAHPKMDSFTTTY